MNQSKLFDVIVPTFRRYDLLPKFFGENAFLSSNAKATLWIVDDCSPTYDKSVIPNWPNLEFIQLPVNRGQAYARNIAIEKGKAPFIISLDDDAWFENGDQALHQLVKLFEEYPKAGCIMFNIATPDSDYSTEPTGTKIPLHITCGCAYRRVVLQQIRGFSSFLHSHAEETDVSLRIYGSGWDIIFANEIHVFHNFKPGERTIKWYLTARFNTTRNDLLVVVMHFPLYLVFPFVLGKYFSHLKFAVINKVSVLKTLAYTSMAFFSFIKLAPEAIRKREPLTRSQFWNWRRMLVEQDSKWKNIIK